MNPGVESQELAKPSWFNRPIIHTPTRDFDIDAVKHVQRVLRTPETGLMDDDTRAHIRGMQTIFDLPVTGIIDLKTAQEVERIRSWSAAH